MVGGVCVSYEHSYTKFSTYRVAKPSAEMPRKQTTVNMCAHAVADFKLVDNDRVHCIYGATVLMYVNSLAWISGRILE